MSYRHHRLEGLGTATDLPPASSLGQIRSQDGYRYQLVPDDLLWLARSVQYEGGDYPSTIWTYAQRQALYHRTSSLESLVRGHSQPVNPAWADPSTPLCQQHPSSCSPAAIARRQEASTLPWSSVRPAVREAVVKWARAELPNPVPRAVDFADPSVSQSYLNRNPTSQIVRRLGNWYLATQASLGWPANFVQMQLGSAVSSVSAGGWLTMVPVAGAIAGAGTLLAVGAYIYAKRSKR